MLVERKVVMMDEGNAQWVSVRAISQAQVKGCSVTTESCDDHVDGRPC